MQIIIENLLTQAQVKDFRSKLAQAPWLDGSASAGGIAAQVKQNRQLDERSEASIELGNIIIRAISQHPSFISAALPDKIYPPKFNAYASGETYGYHVDGALMQMPGTAQTMRTDLSSTLFLSEADEYEGGELEIHTQYGLQTVKLNAGDLVLYPSTSLHQVRPVTSGERIASFFWIQSLVRDQQQRETLYELDQSVQALTRALGADHQEISRLSGIYHNLLRRWACPS